MAHVFVTASREPTPEDVEQREPFAEVFYGGVYFFLYPAIKRLRDVTGELIDPQESAYFAGDDLDSFEAFLTETEDSARSQPSEWQQRVGVLLPGGEVNYQRTFRAEVVDLLRGLATALQKAREGRLGVLFWGD